jgi:hypothetical protein
MSTSTRVGTDCRLLGDAIASLASLGGSSPQDTKAAVDAMREVPLVRGVVSPECTTAAKTGPVEPEWWPKNCRSSKHES